MDGAKYYECHITIEPVEVSELYKLDHVLEPFGFKRANLLMQKNRNETPERSDKDTFCTGHSKEYDDIFDRMQQASGQLKSFGFKIWRKKIEAILYDERIQPKYLRNK